MTIYDQLTNLETFKAVVMTLYYQTFKFPANAPVLDINVIVMAIDSGRQHFLRLIGMVTKAHLIVVTIYN
jgi:hypothetical protein